MRTAPRGGGVPESTSRSVMSPRHSPSGGRAASGSMPVIARIRRGGGGAVRPHHAKVLDRLAVEGCQPRLSDLGSSAPSQQPALTHGSCAPSLSRLLLRYRLPNLKVGWGAEGLRPGSGSSSKSKGEAVDRGGAGSGVVLSLGGNHWREERGGGGGTYQLGCCVPPLGRCGCLAGAMDSGPAGGSKIREREERGEGEAGGGECVALL